MRQGFQQQFPLPFQIGPNVHRIIGWHWDAKIWAVPILGVESRKPVQSLDRWRYMAIIVVMMVVVVVAVVVVVVAVAMVSLQSWYLMTNNDYVIITTSIPIHNHH